MTTDQFWTTHILPTFFEFLRIPNVSPAFDPDWEQNGHMMKAARLVATWVRDQKIPGATVSLEQLPHRTPFLLIDVPGDGDQTVLMYGHLDKQPAASGWQEGLGPWTPVLRDTRLYGRGTVDDGYAVFTAVAAIKALTQQKAARPRIVLILECAEESGLEDLEAYCTEYHARIGTPDLVICLDAGGANYEQLWVSTSQRGTVNGTLKVQVLETGAHSGGASGVVPSSFRIMRILLDRIENAATGEIRLPSLQAVIPPQRLAEAEALAACMGDSIAGAYTFMPGMTPMGATPLEQILNRSWRPTLSYIGMDGMPSCQSGGNALRPMTALKLSFRLPPTVSATQAAQEIQNVLTQDPPYGARVSFELESAGDGWVAPESSPKLTALIHSACMAEFGKPPMAMGLGGSIPFLALFGKKFPKAQFLVTGALGPGSNAHGPNEFVDLSFTQKLSACLLRILSGYC